MKLTNRIVSTLGEKTGGIAAGLITGEAMVGILMAVPIVISGDPDVFALPFTAPVIVGLAVVAACGRRGRGHGRRPDTAHRHPC